MNETYRKVLQIFVMKNYAALVAKLQSRNLPLPRDYFAMSALCSIHVYIGCDWHNFNNYGDGPKTLQTCLYTAVSLPSSIISTNPLNLSHCSMSFVARSAQEVSRSCSCKDWA